MLSTFPLYVEGLLDICDLKLEDLQIDDFKSSCSSSAQIWHSKFCVLMENDSMLYIFNDERTAKRFIAPSHMTKCRLDLELNEFRIDRSYDYVDKDVPVDSNKNETKSSQECGNKANSRSGLFRSGSRLFGRGKITTKFGIGYQSNKCNNFDNNNSTKSLKRTLSLSRTNRKRSEDKSGSKPVPIKMKNTMMSQSTGDLTQVGNSPSVIRYTLQSETIVSDFHSSLVGGRPHCFRVSSFVDEMDTPDSTMDKRSETVSTRLFSASSYLEKQCWMKRLQRTLKPNLENENRTNNSMNLTIFECKGLPVQKRRYFCTVNFDKIPNAKTTSKLSGNDGSIFWADVIVLNNLLDFKTLTISLYKEAESFKDIKRRKKKHYNQFIGQLNFSIYELKSKNEFQAWYTLKSSDLQFERSSSSPIQLRILLRFSSLKVFKTSVYSQLYEAAIGNYMELIHVLEKNLPLKLKEEIAICLVNIHEKNGSIIKFLIDLISEEITDIDDSSMTLRANTIVTKIIENHMKLVGFQYLHDMIAESIYNVVYKDNTVEVDPSRYDVPDDQKSKLLLTNQEELTSYLKIIWDRIFHSKDFEFPKQLKAVFVGWRRILTSRASSNIDREAIDNHCDVIVSGCIFLRLLCPAILSPHMFGLLPSLSEKPTVQRTLTLIAKSLQSLANFSTFGEKEQFMTFLNPCFEKETLRMREFLRDISSEPSSSYERVYDEITVPVTKEIHYYGVTIDLPVELARLYSCLSTDAAKEVIDNSSLLHNNVRLSEVLDQISEQLKAFVETPSKTQSVLKKISKIRAFGPRRACSTQYLNAYDWGNSDLYQIHFRMGTTFAKSPESNPLTAYATSNDMNPAPDTNSIELSITRPQVHYSPKAQAGKNNASTPKVNITANRRANYNARDCELSIGDQTTTFFALDSNENQMEEHFSKISASDIFVPSNHPPRVPPRRPPTIDKTNVRYDKVEDVVRIIPKKIPKTYLNKTDLSDMELYRGNPLYDLVNVATETECPDPCVTRTTAINMYFKIRNKINTLENGGERRDENYELSQLYKQLEEIKIEIHKEQINDLKQLHSMLTCNQSRVPSNCPENPIYDIGMLDYDHRATTDAIDNVIYSISQDEANLVKVQENLHKPIKKPKPPAKHYNLNDNPIKPQELERSFLSVPIDISGDAPNVVDASNPGREKSMAESS